MLMKLIKQSYYYIISIFHDVGKFKENRQFFRITNKNEFDHTK